MAPPWAADDIAFEQCIPRKHTLRRELGERPLGVIGGAASGVHLDKPGKKEFIALKAVDPYMDMNLAAKGESFEPGAGREEGGECGGVDRDAALLDVVEDGEGLSEPAEAGETLDVSVDDVRVLGVEGEGVGERVAFGEFAGLGRGRWMGIGLGWVGERIWRGLGSEGGGFGGGFGEEERR